MGAGRQLVKTLGPDPIIDPLYRLERQLRYRLAGETYAVEASGARARFRIPTQNEWSDFVSIAERPILEDLASSIRRDDVFYDIGANTGLYSCLMANLVEQPVIALEPHPQNARRLEENAELNGADVSVFEYALADSAGDSELSIVLDKIGSAGHSLVSDEGPNTITVPKIRGDDFIADEDLPAPTVLKIDVEGAEYQVLRGLESALSRSDCRMVYCETHADRLRAQGVSVSDVRDELVSHGFSVTEVTVRQGKGETFLVGKADGSSGG
ncbi:FkbM family methyltransferase [Salinigranum rubrum]|uniref:FkbM family methyltransferase n=1 Tax=Salinigranum rubrum TaxID=755307 RepID=A0A2I8VHJ5_9EURY|nr:FkbM family methyltransferase [Salinigranum rubrum]AUV81401.1 FkbM family methyltransferase [Salinigranum rubrum]